MRLLNHDLKLESSRGQDAQIRQQSCLEIDRCSCSFQDIEPSKPVAEVRPLCSNAVLNVLADVVPCGTRRTTADPSGESA